MLGLRFRQDENDYIAVIRKIGLTNHKKLQYGQGSWSGQRLTSCPHVSEQNGLARVRQINFINRKYVLQLRESFQELE